MKVSGINYLSVLERFHDIQNEFFNQGKYNYDFKDLDIGNIIKKYNLYPYTKYEDEKLKEKLKNKSQDELIKIYQDLNKIKLIKRKDEEDFNNRINRFFR